MFKSSKKPTTPPTKTQKGRRWATVIILICGTYSVWANVASGRKDGDSVVVSILPPIVAFCLSHLMGYLNPKTKFQKFLVWAGFGLCLLFAFIASGYHIWEKSHQTGQPWYIALTYPFLSDIPMVFAAVVLVQKVSATAAPAKQTTPAIAPVKAVPAVKPPAKTTPAKKATPTKAAQATTKPVTA